MGFFDSLVGGSSNKLMKQTRADNAERRSFIEEQMGQARNDLFGQYGDARGYLDMGSQAGLDVYGQTIPQMFDVFQQGNVGAQNQLIAGMPQVHNAIMGLPVDYSAFQPVSINYNTDYANQTLPWGSGFQPNFNQPVPAGAGNGGGNSPVGGGSEGGASDGGGTGGGYGGAGGSGWWSAGGSAPNPGAGQGFNDFLDSTIPNSGNIPESQRGTWREFLTAQHGDDIGRVLGALSGVPGGSTLGKLIGEWMGNRHLGSKVWMSDGRHGGKYDAWKGEGPNPGPTPNLNDALNNAFPPNSSDNFGHYNQPVVSAGDNSAFYQGNNSINLPGNFSGTGGVNPFSNSFWGYGMGFGSGYGGGETGFEKYRIKKSN